MTPTLLAENGDTGIMAVLMVVSGVVASCATWLTNYLVTTRKSKRAENKEDEETTIGRLEKLIARQETDRQDAIKREEECQRKYDEQGKELTEVKVECSRAVEWIKNYEFQMKHANVPYRSWKDTPVPPQLQEQMDKAGLKP